MAEEEVKEAQEAAPEEAQADEAKPAAGGADHPKAPLGARAVALIVDGIIGGIAAGIVGGIGGAIWAPLGSLLGGGVAAAWYAFRDTLMEGRSPGKKFLGLTIVTADGQPINQDLAIKRNMPFIVSSAISAITGFLIFIPVLGAILAMIGGLVGLVIGIAEIYFVLTDKKGLRYGDKMANTQVIKA